MQENFQVGRIKIWVFRVVLRSEEFGDIFNREQADIKARRLHAVIGGDGDSYIWIGDNIERDAHKHAGRRAILVCATASNIRTDKCGRGDFVSELRLSRAGAIRQKVIRLQSDNVGGGNVIRARGVGSATMDTARTDKRSTVGIREIDNDSVHGGGSGGQNGSAQQVARFIADSGLCRDTVFIGAKATGLGHVACIYGNIFRNGYRVRDAVENFYRADRRRDSVDADLVAIHEGLSENANHGVP